VAANFFRDPPLPWMLFLAFDGTLQLDSSPSAASWSESFH
jgi:hypothetical protein